jgi:plastocyanin
MAPGSRRWSLAAALLAVALPAVAFAGAGPAPTAVGIGEREFRIAVYRASVPAGPVRFNVTNYGEDRHDLVVLDREDRVLARSAEVSAGGRTSVRVRLSAGTYRLRCDVADHAARGMRATLRVRRPSR